jgi:hypothetical protein
MKIREKEALKALERVRWSRLKAAGKNAHINIGRLLQRSRKMKKGSLCGFEQLDRDI